MSLSDSKQSDLYQEALKITAQAWDDGSIGFAGKETSLGITTTAKQLNTILFAVLRLNSEVQSLKREVAELKKKPSTAEGDIANLTSALEKLHLGGTTFRAPQKGTIKVFKNPFDLLKEIK